MKRKLVLLGTGAAVSEPHRTVTMLAVAGSRGSILVDCGGDAAQRMLVAGIAPQEIESLILTHEHADHVGGFALFMEKIWLMGRRRPLPVYGPEAALHQAERLFATFNTSGWDGLPGLVWHPIPLSERVVALTTEDFCVSTSPGVHGVETIGVRFDAVDGHQSVVYSSDTEPCGSIERLASGATLLVHEATGSLPGHSSALDAARLASRAGVRSLLLVHLPERLIETDFEKARQAFVRTERGREMGTYPF